jgi:DNA-binding transcriptional regulator GbsR (MarR family)
MTQEQLDQAQTHFIQGMSRISGFWGFPKAMGAIYGAIYLSPSPLSLDEIVEQVGVSKGAVSTHVRQLERLSMVHKHLQLGDRKDYYTAETDFWKMIRSILQQREQNEFDKALSTVSESLEMLEQSEVDPEMVGFYQERMEAMQSFFKSLDSLFSAALALEGLVSLSMLKNLVEKAGKK